MGDTQHQPTNQTLAVYGSNASTSNWGMDIHCTLVFCFNETTYQNLFTLNMMSDDCNFLQQKIYLLYK